MFYSLWQSLQDTGASSGPGLSPATTCATPNSYIVLGSFCQAARQSLELACLRLVDLIQPRAPCAQTQFVCRACRSLPLCPFTTFLWRRVNNCMPAGVGEIFNEVESGLGHRDFGCFFGHTQPILTCAKTCRKHVSATVAVLGVCVRAMSPF